MKPRALTIVTGFYLVLLGFSVVILVKPRGLLKLSFFSEFYLVLLYFPSFVGT